MQGRVQRWAFALTAFQILLSSCSDAQIKTYNVGIWYPTTKEGVMALYRPLFEDFVNQAIQSKVNAKLKVVVVDTDASILAENFIDANKIDFFYSMAGRIACVERAFDWIVIASARNRILGLEAGSQGTLLYSLKSNSAIKSISDFKGKKIGLPHIQSSSFYVGMQVLNDHGIDVYRDASQITFYGNGYADQLSHVLMGKIDVGVTASTYILQRFPEQLPNLVFHGLLNGTSYEGEPYPFPTSSWLAPAFSLAASPAVPSAVKNAVAEALMGLDPQSSVGKTASLSNFTTPASHFDVRSSMEKANLFDPAGRCYSALGDMTLVMKCPKGLVLDTESGLHRRCEFNHLACPPGYTCFCNPCVPSINISIFPGEVVLGLASTLFMLNLALVVCWGFGLELRGCLQRPVRSLARKAGENWRRRKSVARY